MCECVCAPKLLSWPIALPSPLPPSVTAFPRRRPPAAPPQSATSGGCTRSTTTLLSSTVPEVGGGGGRGGNQSISRFSPCYASCACVSICKAVVNTVLYCVQIPLLTFTLSGTHYESAAASFLSASTHADEPSLLLLLLLPGTY